MSVVLIPVLYALFLWWFSTGLLLYIDGLRKATFPWSMAIMSAIAVLALYGLRATHDDASALGAFCAFSCALLIWAWHELSFLLGYLTGPRRTPLPEGVGGLRRFWLATQTLIFHELAILGTVIAIAVLLHGGSNQVGLWTFVALWLMRLSAKMNIFLGVPNLSEELLPAHLRYLKSYFRRRPINLLFPFSVTISSAVAGWLVYEALAPHATPFTTTGDLLIAALLALAAIEHWFLILPVRDSALWRWALRSHKQRRAEASSDCPPQRVIVSSNVVKATASVIRSG